MASPQPPKEDGVLRVADITVDVKKRQALLGSQPLTLTPHAPQAIALSIRRRSLNRRKAL